MSYGGSPSVLYDPPECGTHDKRPPTFSTERKLLVGSSAASCQPTRIWGRLASLPFGLVLALLIGAVHFGGPQPVTAFATNVVVLSSYHWVDSNGWVHVAGEVQNQGSTLEHVTIDAILYDAGGDNFASTHGGPFYPNLPPGARSAFDLQTATKRTDIDRIALYVDRTYPEWRADGTVSVRVTATTIDAGRLIIEGTLTNGVPYRVANPNVIATMRSSDNVMLGWAKGTLKPTDEGWPRTYIAGLATEPFVLTVPADQWDGEQRFTLQASAGISDVDADGAILSWDVYLEDIGYSRFRDDILWLANADITKGCAPYLYCPSAEVSREQMASFLVRALGLVDGGHIDYFTDDDTSGHEVDINRLRHAGITLGCGGSKFCPRGLVTREQMASFLVRALGLPRTTVDYFTDDETSGHEADINALASAGVTKGCSRTTFCPKHTVTREQMAAFLRRGLAE